MTACSTRRDAMRRDGAAAESQRLLLQPPRVLPVSCALTEASPGVGVRGRLSLPLSAAKQRRVCQGVTQWRVTRWLIDPVHRCGAGQATSGHVGSGRVGPTARDGGGSAKSLCGLSAEHHQLSALRSRARGSGLKAQD